MWGEMCEEKKNATTVYDTTTSTENNEKTWKRRGKRNGTTKGNASQQFSEPALHFPSETIRCKMYVLTGII